jgi:hypothetical protein
MANESLLETIVREFERMKQQSERAIAQVDDDAFFTCLSNEDNSIAIIVKHIAGNMRSRWRDFLTTDGEKPDRNRDMEFIIESEESRDAVMAQWETGWQFLFDAIRPLTPEDGDRTVTIRGEEMTAMQAIMRQITHYSYHVGQIVLLAKHFAGENWQTLSVPRGGSVQFNSKPAPYL